MKTSGLFKPGWGYIMTPNTLQNVGVLGPGTLSLWWNKLTDAGGILL